MLKTQRKRYFRNLLHQRIEELTEKSVGARMNWDIKGAKFPDLVDWAAAEQERELGLRIIERDAALRGEVRLALEKIDNGTYGICESCEREIEPARLEALPITSLCIECKRREEAKQRMKRTANLKA
jgi:DnaK suppressor protein